MYRGLHLIAIDVSGAVCRSRRPRTLIARHCQLDALQPERQALSTDLEHTPLGTTPRSHLTGTQRRLYAENAALLR